MLQGFCLVAVMVLGGTLTHIYGFGAWALGTAMMFFGILYGVLGRTRRGY